MRNLLWYGSCAAGWAGIAVVIVLDARLRRQSPQRHGRA